MSSSLAGYPLDAGGVGGVPAERQAKNSSVSSA
jgi:hypothetical protein